MFSLLWFYRCCLVLLFRVLVANVVAVLNVAITVASWLLSIYVVVVVVFAAAAVVVVY